MARCIRNVTLTTVREVTLCEGNWSQGEQLKVDNTVKVRDVYLAVCVEEGVRQRGVVSGPEKRGRCVCTLLKECFLMGIRNKGRETRWRPGLRLHGLMNHGLGKRKWTGTPQKKISKEQTGIRGTPGLKSSEEWSCC